MLVVEAGEVEFDGHGGGANKRVCGRRSGDLASAAAAEGGAVERLATHEESFFVTVS